MKRIDMIFIVDDDPITVFGIKKMLGALADCRNILEFPDGEKAIEQIKRMIIKKQELPDIIFLDINMPIMDGWEFLEEFVNLPIKKTVNINIVTSSIDQNDKDRSDNFKSMTHHSIIFNSKPILRKEIEEITNAVGS